MVMHLMRDHYMWGMYAAHLCHHSQRNDSAMQKGICEAPTMRYHHNTCVTPLRTQIDTETP